MMSVKEMQDCDSSFVDYSYNIDSIVAEVNQGSGNTFSNIDEHDVEEASSSSSSSKGAQGPRQLGEGIEQRQGILYAYRNGSQALYIFTTILVAGFLIGRLGQTIQSISRRTGASITSVNKQRNGKKVRVFHIQGSEEAIYKALKIIMAAIDHYKRLVEGDYQGVYVNKDQVVEGITFQYEAPPLRDVPWSARVRHEQDYPPLMTAERYPTTDEQQTTPLQPSPCSPITMATNPSPSNHPYPCSRSVAPSPPALPTFAHQQLLCGQQHAMATPMVQKYVGSTRQPLRQLASEYLLPQTAYWQSASPHSDYVQSQRVVQYRQAVPPHLVYESCYAQNYGDHLQYYETAATTAAAAYNASIQRQVSQAAQPMLWCGPYNGIHYV
eukprot:TRINITY_DN3845_c0_g1_i1.p1 TRINITY_DN3845_c0_g1~~TRINITY_DN3845_c0_g1_i1.p1  ORF type:complete len:382 (+),score=21.47 TRINITY_DN3845_c0_g1_i1:250-1395(+)